MTPQVRRDSQDQNFKSEGLACAHDCIAINTLLREQIRTYTRLAGSTRARLIRPNKILFCMRERAATRSSVGSRLQHIDSLLYGSLRNTPGHNGENRHVRPQDFRSINSTFNSCARGRSHSRGALLLVSRVTTSPFLSLFPPFAARISSPATLSLSARKERGSKHIDERPNGVRPWRDAR